MVNPIYGNHKALETLTFMQQSGRLCHAYLFWGEKGLGKRTMASRFAAQILCQGEDKPCGECPSCIKLAHSAHPDVRVIDNDGRKNSLHVETVRELRADAYIRPNESTYKIDILTDVDALSPGAANALLKILEEPPRHMIFLLTCQNRGSVPETIVSRCVQIALAPVDEATCLEAVKALAPSDASPGQISLAAQSAKGNIGRALATLSDPTAAEAEQTARRIASSIARSDEFGVLTALAAKESDRQFLRTVFIRLSELLQTVLEAKSRRQLPGGETGDLASVLTSRQALAMIDVLARAQASIDKNMGSPLLCTWVSAALASCRG